MKIEHKELNDLAAERAVLSGLCQYGVDILMDVDFLNIGHFYDPVNQVLFECITDCIKRGVAVELSAILSRSIELGFEEMLENDEEIGFMRSLFNFPVIKDNVPIYAAKLAKMHIIKDMQRTLDRCDKQISSFNGDEDLQDIMNAIETPLQTILTEVYNTSDTKPKLIGDGIDDYIQNLIDNPNSMRGIPSGFPSFDKAIGGGLRRKCVDLVGARTKVGKSLFADAVALNVAINEGVPVLMMDTEMDSDDHKNRILSNLSSVSLDDLGAGTFVGSEFKENSIRKAAETIKSIPYSYINVAGQNFDYIVSVARQWIYQNVGFDENGKTNDCLIIFDYLKMMDSKDISESMKEYQVLGFQMTKLHNFCVKYDVPCLSFIQLNRDGITKESTDAASGSDRIMWLCTSFSILKEKAPEEQADDRTHGATVTYNRKLVPIISRHGGGLDSGDYINIHMEGQYARLTEGPTRNRLMRTNGNGQSITTGQPTDISSV